MDCSDHQYCFWDCLPAMDFGGILREVTTSTTSAQALADYVDETPVTKEQINEHTVAPLHPRYLSIHR